MCAVISITQSTRAPTRIKDCLQRSHDSGIERAYRIYNRVAEIAIRATSICDHERTTTIQETVDPSMGQRRDRTVGLRLELGSAELGLWIKI